MVIVIGTVYSNPEEALMAVVQLGKDAEEMLRSEGVKIDTSDYPGDNK